MLTGGASAYYAEKLIADERNAIALTGYQDEESPGRHLLDLAEGKVGHLNIGGRAHEVKAQASKYSLSAHGDANEIISVIEALDPRHVVLVHGEGRARPALAELINRNSRRNRVVHLPRTGDTLHFGATRRALYPQQRVHIGFGGGEDLSDEGLHKLAGELRRQGEERRAFSEIDLLDAWFGQGSWTEAQYEEIVRALDGTKAFRPHPSRPHLYRLPRLDAEEPDATPAMFYAEPNELLHRIETALPKDAGLYRKGYDLANHEVRLWFNFPLIARERFRETLKKLLEGTGWTYSVNEQPHQIRLAEAATEAFPEAIRSVLQTPAIRLDTCEVTIKAVAAINHTTRDEAARKFSETTGFTLRVLAPDEVRLEGDSSSETPARFVDESQLSILVPLEINLTYKTIDEAFQQQPESWRPSRKSLKTEGVNTYIELAFISPQTGMRQRALIAELARRIGREVRIKPEPNQIALSELAARMIPSGWHLLKTPSVHKAQSEISVRLARAPLLTDEVWINLAKEFYEQTGYRLTQS